MKCLNSKYWTQITVGSIAYASGMGIMYYFYGAHPHSPYRFWLVLLPVLPIIYLTVIVHRHLSEKDELWRKIITESLAFSAIATAFTCFGYRFVREAVGAPEFHAEWAFYLVWAYYGIGALVSFWGRR